MVSNLLGTFSDIVKVISRYLRVKGIAGKLVQNNQSSDEWIRRLDREGKNFGLNNQ